VWEVLSVNTTPARRDAAFGALKRIPALTPDAIARVPQAKLDAAVGQAGPLKDERMRALRAGADLFRRSPTIVEDLAAPLARALRAARRVPHLGHASALRLLLFASDLPLLPLDEPALRVARRLGYGVEANHPMRVLRSTRQALVRECGGNVGTLKSVARFFTHHGQSACLETSPHCTVCPIVDACEWIRRQ
jgi:endonuclease III